MNSKEVYNLRYCVCTGTFWTFCISEGKLFFILDFCFDFQGHVTI